MSIQTRSLRSTARKVLMVPLLALVMAFAGVQSTRDAYRHAVEQRFRFYSYGDAMWVR